MRSTRRSLLFGVLLFAIVAGCALVQVENPGKSPLKQIGLADDGVALEVIFARFPFAETEMNGPLWSEVDEQQFPTELRRRMAKNGFRAGVMGQEMPAALARLVAETEQPTASLDAVVTKLESEPLVRRRLLQLRAGRRSEIVASGIYDELPLLMSEEGQARGKTYQQAQGIFALKAYPEGDGRVRLKLTPELQHGQPRQQFVSEDGVLRPQASRPRHLFEDLCLEVTLSPGQVLLVSTAVDRPGSAGHYFFTEPSSGSLQQKMLLVRLAKTNYDDLFAQQLKPPAEEQEAKQDEPPSDPE